MSQQDYIDIEVLIKSKNPRLLKWLPRFVLAFLKRKLHQDEINAFIRAKGHLKDHDFCEAIIDYFQIQIDVQGLEHIPANGGVILALNHPLGGMDGVALIHAIRHKRPDVALIVNDLLLNITQLSNLFIGINKFGRNYGGVRQNIRSAFEKEQAVIIFPAGLVAIFFTMSRMRGTLWGSSPIRQAARAAARMLSGDCPAGSGSERITSAATSSPVIALGNP